jgi:hypothetical protein
VAEVVQHLPSKHKALCHQKREKGSKKEWEWSDYCLDITVGYV